MSEDRVSIEVADHVATVTLNRPDKHNALDVPMFDAIIGAARRLSADPGVRAVVLHGSGRSFCSGLDVTAVMASSNDGDALTRPLHDPPPNHFQQAAYEWILAPMPVIAAIHGHCLGGGLQIALGADIRIASPDANLSVLEVRWGLIPDMAITRTLPRLVGIDVAKELAFTGRAFSGEEARALGVVTHVSEDPLGAARALASEIAARSPDAVRRAKRLFQEGWSGSPEETMALEARLQLEIAGGRNQLAAVAAGLAKQPAEFVDPTGVE
jgi:enoyl-CoA hydratase/carnithine racemase